MFNSVSFCWPKPRPCDCDEYCPRCGRRKHQTYPWRPSYPWEVRPWPVYIEPARNPYREPNVGEEYNPTRPFNSI